MVRREHMWWAASVSAGALCLLFANRSAAEDAESTDTTRARELYVEGLQAARGDSWDAARVAFERSYELSPRAATLLNLAGAQSESGRLVASVASYRRFLDEAPGTSAERHLAAARDALAAVEARVPRLHVYVRGYSDQDRLVIDGRVLAVRVARSEIMDPGPHVVELWRGNRMLVVRRVHLDERDDERLDLVAPRADAGQAPAMVPPEATEETPEERAARGRAMRISGIALFSIAGVGLVSFAGLYFGSNALYDEWEPEEEALREIYRLPMDSPDRPSVAETEARQSDNNDLWVRIEVMTRASYGMVALGVVSLAVAFGVYFGAPRDEAPAVSLLPGPRGAVLTVPFSLF